MALARVLDRGGAFYAPRPQPRSALRGRDTLERRRIGMQRSRTLRLAGIALLACAVAIQAQAEDDELLYAQRGVYLSAAANYMIPTRPDDISDEVEKSLGGGPLVSSDVDNSWGMNARLGYRLNPRMAVEGQFEWVANFEVDAQVAGVESKEEIALMALTANGKYFFLTGRIQPYAVAGLGWGRSRVKPAIGGSTNRENGWVARGGAGVNIYGSPDVAFTLETSYVHPASGNIEDLDYVSFNAGLMLLFYGE
jgi:opacity protein-like surface antigen